MKKQNIGISVSLLGIILALSQETIPYLVGVILGIAGLLLTVFGAKED